MSDYIEILREWERKVANPAIYESLDVLLPSYAFKRVGARGPRDHWASRMKIDHSPSRSANPEKTVVYPQDFRLREQGEWDNPLRVVDAIAAEHGLNGVYDVYSWVSARLALDMPRPDSEETAVRARAHVRRASLLEDLTEYFRWHLWNNANSRKAQTVRAYLKRARGFSEDQAREIGFGFVPSWDAVERHFVVDRKYSREELEAACRVRNDEGKTSVGHKHILSIPYMCAGETKGFLFRAIDSSVQPKYLANTGLDRKSCFFNMPVSASDIIIVEGEIDALTLASRGFAGVVAIGGSEISGERRRQFEDALRRGVRRVALCLDLDWKEKGDAAAPDYGSRHAHIMKSIHTIKDIDPGFEDIYVAELPRPGDPDEFIRSEGADAFTAVLAASKPYWKYLCDYMETHR
ncbi:MAG: toprim domain-containing protein [Bacteroidales bacterium]|nr:toprim domain-containing protein [Bacteroidales bacterium]